MPISTNVANMVQIIEFIFFVHRKGHAQVEIILTKKNLYWLHFQNFSCNVQYGVISTNAVDKARDFKYRLQNLVEKIAIRYIENTPKSVRNLVLHLVPSAHTCYSFQVGWGMSDGSAKEILNASSPDQTKLKLAPYKLSEAKNVKFNCSYKLKEYSCL